MHFTSILLFRHSRYICDRLRGVMAEEMKSKITEYLIRVDPVVQYLVPFSITFDKMTLLKRSIQTTILITLVDGVLTPIYLQSPLCKTELGGKELAEKWVQWNYLDPRLGNSGSLFQTTVAFAWWTPLVCLKRFCNSSSLVVPLMAHTYI